MTTQLNYQDKFGYFGLRVDPSYEQMLRTVNKQIRIPVPDRAAKWYALGPYRAFLMEQAKRHNDSQRADLAYDDTGAHLPAAAARAQHGSMAGTDDTWDNVSKYTSDLNAEEARQLAEEAMASEKRAQANSMRRQQLSAYGPSKSHWTITAHHEDLTERNVPHQAPRQRWPCPLGDGGRLPTSWRRTAIPRRRSSRPGSSSTWATPETTSSGARLPCKQTDTTSSSARITLA